MFPTLLLFVTLFRLSLNIASTRLILLDGYAGHIIETFGNFVVRGNYVVGLVVFFILVVINFIVITKGAGRIAEVAARFTLDAMPGKQMAIDAELNAGVINEASRASAAARSSRKPTFYGAMDGASKFVRGDAIAAVLITLINIIGGFAIGIMQKGMSVPESLSALHAALHRRWPGLADSRPHYVDGCRHPGDSRGHEGRARHGVGQATPSLPRAMWILTRMLLVFSMIPGSANVSVSRAGGHYRYRWPTPSGTTGSGWRQRSVVRTKPKHVRSRQARKVDPAQRRKAPVRARSSKVS